MILIVYSFYIYIYLDLFLVEYIAVRSGDEKGAQPVRHHIQRKTKEPPLLQEMEMG